MKKILGACLAIIPAVAFSATELPVQLINPAGSTAGQVIVSNGPGSAPGWAALTGLGTPFSALTSGAVGGSSVTSSRVARLFDGSSSTPVTTIAPSVGISRYEAINNIDTEGGQNPALYVQTTGNNTSVGSTIAQAAGITANAQQIGSGDVVAVYGTATQAGTLAGRWAYGGFFNANANVAGANAYAVETFQFNNTGADAPLTLGGIPAMVGLHVGAGGANLNTVGAWFGNNGGGTQFDAGLYFSPGAIKSNTIVDDTSASNSILVKGTHGIGLNMSGATFTANAIATPGFTVSPVGAVSTSIVPTSAWAFDSTGSTVTIANGANASLPAGNGLIIVEESVTSNSAMYMCSTGACTMIGEVGTVWSASTTTPTAGHLSLNYDGSTAYRIYNNQGASENVTVMLLKMKATN
ncbi:hypothetical protein C7410_115163 [Paraburkholderia silvatlantica]|uniref:Uncharacterized protein n=1 Tax=Paraburkholderia silvatlantica TaxID=321895 RepID=A0A2V4TZE8_9BURK|nr:hypothetical protein [Paraburkholderia silvatlantica]PYE21320.1 hypothetical protein C7410_115163 [Paraburkholderia silvatlantica]